MRKMIEMIMVLAIIASVNAAGHADETAGKEGKGVHAHEKGHECYKSITFQASALQKQKKYSEAIEILEKARAKTEYDHHSQEIYTALFNVYNESEQFEKNIGLWNEGHKKGMVFNIDPAEEKYKAYHRIKGFRELADKDKELSDAAVKEGKETSEIRVDQHKKRDHEKKENKKAHKETR